MTNINKITQIHNPYPTSRRLTTPSPREHIHGGPPPPPPPPPPGDRGGGALRLVEGVAEGLPLAGDAVGKSLTGPGARRRGGGVCAGNNPPVHDGANSSNIGMPHKWRLRALKNRSTYTQPDK